MNNIINPISKYKKTKIGTIPIDWEFCKLSKAIHSISSGVSVNGASRPKNTGEFGVLKTSAVYGARYNPSANKAILDEAEISRAKLSPKAGCLLISRANSPELVGTCSYIDETDDSLFLPDKLWMLVANEGFDAKWLNYLLGTALYRHLIDVRSTGTSSSMKNISMPSFKSLPIALPPFFEQKKIAAILSTWDEAINATQALIDKLELRKKGLMQQLLTGKKRMKGFDQSWNSQKLGQFFTERKEANNSGLPLLSVGRNGVYPQDLDNRKDSSNSDKSKYKRICPGDIGYNTMRMWQGRSALSHLEGIVSPAYTIVSPKENANSVFFSYLFQLDKMIHKFYQNSQGMVSDNWMCKFKDFTNIKIEAPSSKAEQDAIASILEAADAEIGSIKKKLEILLSEKKGLMQQLLTGKKRVKID